jgi:hypothetical protein
MICIRAQAYRDESLSWMTKFAWSWVRHERLSGYIRIEG